MKRIFLSYSTEDRSTAERFKQSIRDGVIPGLASDVVIYDSVETSSSSTDIRSTILVQLKASNQVMAMWSSNASTSPRVNYELGVAAALDIPTTIVVVGDDAPAVPSDISGVNVLKLP